MFSDLDLKGLLKDHCILEKLPVRCADCLEAKYFHDDHEGRDSLCLFLLRFGG